MRSVREECWGGVLVRWGEVGRVWVIAVTAGERLWAVTSESLTVSLRSRPARPAWSRHHTPPHTTHHTPHTTITLQHWSSMIV